MDKTWVFKLHDNDSYPVAHRMYEDGDTLSMVTEMFGINNVRNREELENFAEFKILAPEEPVILLLYLKNPGKSAKFNYMASGLAGRPITGTAILCSAKPSDEAGKYLLSGIDDDEMQSLSLELAEYYNESLEK